MLSHYSHCVFFFFQAEDGIRDIGVTGVQTCALPISPSRSPSGAVPSRSTSSAPTGRLTPTCPAGSAVRRFSAGRTGKGWGGEGGWIWGAAVSLKKKKIVYNATMELTSYTIATNVHVE